PIVIAGLKFGCATKLRWLNDSLNTAKQLVLLGDSSVGRFHRNNALAQTFLSLQGELRDQ
ncbi:hypothetical protein P7K49_003582, partial [Saguinus oedipus]